MTIQDILRRVDHTLLRPTATWNEIQTLCDEAIEFQTASVCIPACYVKAAKDYVGDKMRVCTVIGFPNGYSTTAVKCLETTQAVENGADEIDMVINLGWLKDGKYPQIEAEIRQVLAACKGKVLKVIIETCQLTEQEKIEMCRVVSAAGAHYIKTSTGFSTGGATPEDVALFAKHVDESVKIKAAGGIASIDDAKRFIDLGADRLGTSKMVAIAKKG